VSCQLETKGENTVNKRLMAPLALGPYKLRNRVVMAPLTRTRAGDRNVPREMNILYYRQRATAGLIISEATSVSPFGYGYYGTPGIHTKEQRDAWKRITDAVHEEGGLIFLQLWHVGRISHQDLQPGGILPVSASAIQPRGNSLTRDGLKPHPTPRALRP
jgi:N-ethylmaleimide reductase